MNWLLFLLVLHICLFGISSGQDCKCEECKKITSGDYIGMWNLVGAGVGDKCVYDDGRWCMYQRVSDGAEMCFCDPGPFYYDQCEPFTDALCYNDSATPKLLTGHYADLPDNSVENCRAECKRVSSSFTFLGVEAGTGCYCGNTEPPTDEHPKVWATKCNLACPGEPSQYCGGSPSFANVWRVDI